MSSAALELRGVERFYDTARGKLEVLRGADLSLQPGEMVGLVAPSGAGKSTLLHTTGLLERPDGGEVLIGGDACGKLDDRQRTRMRRKSIGFIYQFHHLLPEFSAMENIVIPQMFLGVDQTDAEKRANDLLEFLGIAERGGHRPAELSGGEQQRVAIARSIANGPRLLLADEPTGNLDPSTSDRVFEALQGLVRTSGVAAFIATHNHELAARMDRVVTLRDGKIMPFE
ncbi:MAG: ABC transporter ATP-binding protein [Pseudomonadota bacterium]